MGWLEVTNITRHHIAGLFYYDRGSKLGNDVRMMVTTWRCERNWDEVCIRCTPMVCHYKFQMGWRWRWLFFFLVGYVRGKVGGANLPWGWHYGIVNITDWLYSALSRHLLVGGWATPLKNMSSSIGMTTFPIYAKIKNVNQTTNQSE